MSCGIHQALDKKGSTGSNLGVNAHMLYGLSANELTHHGEHLLINKIHQQQSLYILGLGLTL